MTMNVTGFASEVHISTDSGSVTYTPADVPEYLDSATVEACVTNFFGGKFATLEQMKSYLERVGGYGFVEVDGEIVMEVKS